MGEEVMVAAVWAWEEEARGWEAGVRGWEEEATGWEAAVRGWEEEEEEEATEAAGGRRAAGSANTRAQHSSLPASGPCRTR